MEENNATKSPKKKRDFNGGGGSLFRRVWERAKERLDNNCMFYRKTI